MVMVLSFFVFTSASHKSNKKELVYKIYVRLIRLPIPPNSCPNPEPATLMPVLTPLTESTHMLVKSPNPIMSTNSPPI